jgi:transposase
MEVAVIGLDLAKTAIQLHGVDRRGNVFVRKKLTRAKLLGFFANLPRCLVGLEAGSGAHYWARELGKLGHEVRLMPPQYVKPYVKTNKHDAADAEACCEAVQRSSMRVIPVKSEGQQSLLMLHRVRDQLIGQRTATINALRGHLAEFGLVAAQKRRGLGELRAIIADLEDDRLPPLARELLQVLVAQLRVLDQRLEERDRRLGDLAREDGPCRRLAEIPGIGPVIATALVGTLTNARQFASGRHLAAWLGLVPRQHATGGKERLLGLSKRGDGYLRRQLIHGARAVVRVAQGREGPLWTWINRLRAWRHFNVVVAAVANKMARGAWVLLARDENWRPA